MEISELEQLPDNGFTELWLHYIWLKCKLDDVRLRTEEGQDLTVIFPGWYNRSWGPDFSEARIVIDGIEYFGDVEIHVTESSWRKHHHDKDSVYNRVILHVFFRKDGEAAINQLGRKVPTLFMGSTAFSDVWYRYDIRRPLVLKELPGACGLCLTADRYQKLKNLVFQAAEQRLIAKSALMTEELTDAGQEKAENLLFKKICQAAGYTTYAQAFSELAAKYPYNLVGSFFRSMHRQNRIEILGRWLGFMGFLNRIKPESVHDSYRREWLAFQQLWNGIQDSETIVLSDAVKPSRPYNHPMRRLVGLYYHLEKIQFQGLLKSWLKFLMECRKALAAGKRPLSTVQELLDDMFPQPDWEPLGRLTTINSQVLSDRSKRLIGKQRQLIILVNAVIPFFLSWSRANGEQQLERTLFDLFLILPAESENRKTRFLEQRLLSLNPGLKMKKNLSYHQGLIQLHDDCCKSYYQGCQNCTLVKLLQKPEIE